MSTLNDAMFDSLRTLGYTGALNDMLVQWLQFNGAVSGAISDAWYEMLISIGVAPAAFNDMWFEALGLLGYEGAINDRELLFWLDVPADLPLPTVWFDETSYDVLVGVTGWNNVGDDTQFNFDQPTGVIAPVIVNELDAANYTLGYIGVTVPVPVAQPLEGFIVVDINDLTTVQTILAADANAVDSKVEITISAGDLLLRTTPLADQNWTTISLTLTTTGVYVIYFKVDGATSDLFFKDPSGANSVTSGALDANDFLFARIGNSALPARPFLGSGCELRFYIANILTNTEILRILTSLHNKWVA